MRLIPAAVCCQVNPLEAELGDRAGDSCAHLYGVVALVAFNMPSPLERALLYAFGGGLRTEPPSFLHWRTCLLQTQLGTCGTGVGVEDSYVGIGWLKGAQQRW